MFAYFLSAEFTSFIFRHFYDGVFCFTDRSLGFPIGMNLNFFCETLNSCTIVCLLIFCRFKFLYIEFSSETTLILSDISFCFL